eukprot:3986859-Lingulodinium_polyedra.AAC.1
MAVSRPSKRSGAEPWSSAPRCTPRSGGTPSWGPSRPGSTRWEPPTARQKRSWDGTPADACAGGPWTSR